MSFPLSFLLYAVYAAYMLDCIVGVRLVLKYRKQAKRDNEGTLWGVILSRALTTAVLTLCLLQMLPMSVFERWICVCLAMLSLFVSAILLWQRVVAPYTDSIPFVPTPISVHGFSSSYAFPVNPRFEELWSANPQYYDAGGIRLRKVELPHWRFESSDFTDVIFVLEGIIIVETAIGSPNGAATRHAVDLVWQIAEEMNIRHTKAVLFSDAYNVRKSTFEARKVAGVFYGEAALIWDCYLFLNPSVRVMFRLSKPFAPSAFRSIHVVDSFHDGIRAILSQFIHSMPSPSDAPLHQHKYVFPTNPYFEERWKYSLEYFEYKGLKLRKIQPTEWRYQEVENGQVILMLEGAMVVATVQSTTLDGTSIQAMMHHLMQVLRQNGNETLPMCLALDFSAVPTDVALLWAEAAMELHHCTLHQVCCITSPLVKGTVHASSASSSHTLTDGASFGSADSQKIVVSFVATLDEALDVMLLHFSSNEHVHTPPELFELQTDNSTENYHEVRIEQIYTLLARIADNDPETLEPPQLPSSDLYADVFKAMEIVYDDKRRQMQEILDQKYLLEKQSAQIQEVNTQLSLHNTQLDEQNQQLAALNTEKNELMSIVAHDLKNPIGAMRSMAELIAAGQVAHPQNTADNIVNTANRMLALVGNLLDLNRLESGAMTFRCVAIDIAPFIESTIWQYRHAAEKKNITFQYNAETSSTLALADEQAILQIVDNLLSNAVKYSPQGKTIHIVIKDTYGSINDGADAKNVNGQEEHTIVSSSLRMEVRDEGEGISSEDMKRLFGKFVRLSAQPTGGEHSTGLGLSIVKKMVEAMQGRVWCESERGCGATFIVELPKASSK